MEQSLNQYKIFYEVARCGNISKAAEKLYISQPAVSKSIINLESALSTTLFIRSKRGVKLTDEGRTLYESLGIAFDSIERAEKRLKRMEELGIGQIRIGASTSLCKHILLPYLQDYIELYPHVKISIDCKPTCETLKQLKEDKIDIGLICETELDKGYHFMPVCTIQDTFVATKTYLDNLALREEHNSTFREDHNSTLNEKDTPYNNEYSDINTANIYTDYIDADNIDTDDIDTDDIDTDDIDADDINADNIRADNIVFKKSSLDSSTENKNDSLLQNMAGLIMFSDHSVSRHNYSKMTEKEILEKCNLMLLDQGNISRIYIDDYMKDNNINPSQVFEINNMDLLIDFAAIGMGVSGVVREFITDYLKTDQVIELPSDYPIAPRTVGFVYNENNLSVSAKKFLDYVNNE